MIKGRAKACLRGFGNDPRALPSAFTGDRLWRGPFLRAFAPIRPGDKTGNKTGSKPVVNRQPPAHGRQKSRLFGRYLATGFIPIYRCKSLFLVKTCKSLQASRFRRNLLSSLDLWEALGTAIAVFASRGLRVRTPSSPFP